MVQGNIASKVHRLPYSIREGNNSVPRGRDGFVCAFSHVAERVTEEVENWQMNLK